MAQPARLAALPGAFLLAAAGDAPQKLVAPSAAAHGRFGESVSVAADIAVVGQPGATSSTAPGSAHVHRELGGTWVHEAELAGSQAEPGDGFGIAVATDGPRVLVGASFPGGASGPPGKAYVFSRTRTKWLEEAVLVPFDGANDDAFGSAVAIEGDTLAVGAPVRDEGGAFDTGAVYVFGRGANGWELRAAILASDHEAFDRFGASLALDGDLLAVGAPGDDDQGGLAGAAYVFERVGATWTERAKLYAEDASPLDRFATSIDASHGRIVAGAPMWSDVGSAYVFHPRPGGWAPAAKLLPPQPRLTGGFGVSVAIDGPVIAVGAPFHDRAAVDGGSVSLFHLLPVGWSHVDELAAPDGGVDDHFGWSVSVSGWSLCAGAPHADAPEPDAGAAYAARFALPAVGSPYCAGDGSSTECPCINTGGTGRGCANSAGPGARLAGLSSASAAADDLRFAADGLPPLQPALLFAGANAVGGGQGAPFGDGLRCAGGALRRLGVRVADAAGEAAWGPGLIAQGGFRAGELARFQTWYRDPLGGPCGFGFNLSQGVAVELER